MEVFIIIFILSKKHIYFFILIIILIFIVLNSFVNGSSDEDIPYLKYESTEKKAYLTFDDGPTKSTTPKILDILKNNNINATFFVVGKNVEANPDIIKRSYNEGNFIANHTYSHQNNILYQDEETFLSEIEKTDLIISKAINKKNYSSKLFRFPNGFSSNNYHYEKEKACKYLNSINYHFIDWNCTLEDSTYKLSNYELMQNLKNSSKGKGTLVILMHDSGYVNKTDEVLQDVINYLKYNGYSFHTLNELIF